MNYIFYFCAMKRKCFVLNNAFYTDKYLYHKNLSLYVT